MPVFRWNDWNVEHVSGHGVHPADAESVVRRAGPPYPEVVGDGKHRVRGRSEWGDYLQVIFLIDEEEGEDPGPVFFIIHARPLTRNEKRQLRRRRQ